MSVNIMSILFIVGVYLFPNKKPTHNRQCIGFSISSVHVSMCLCLYMC